MSSTSPDDLPDLPPLPARPELRDRRRVDPTLASTIAFDQQHMAKLEKDLPMEDKLRLYSLYLAQYKSALSTPAFDWQTLQWYWLRAARLRDSISEVVAKVRAIADATPKELDDAIQQVRRDMAQGKVANVGNVLALARQGMLLGVWRDDVPDSRLTEAFILVGDGAKHNRRIALGEFKQAVAQGRSPQQLRDKVNACVGAERDAQLLGVSDLNSPESQEINRIIGQAMNL
jgi:hypothetical protein